MTINELRLLAQALGGFGLVCLATAIALLMDDDDGDSPPFGDDQFGSNRPVCKTH